MHDPNRQCFHLCIVNLVIGTLYCTKGNYEFGISRVIKSLEPYDKKLETDTWFYAKRCVVALLDLLCKHMITVPDSTLDEVMWRGDEDAADARARVRRRRRVARSLSRALSRRPFAFADFRKSIIIRRR